MGKHNEWPEGRFDEHPENFLREKADHTLRHRPEPRDFDELADSPDPVLEEKRNAQSTKQAVLFCVGTILMTGVVAFVLAIIARAVGGPYCDAGRAQWLCSRAAEIWWPLATSVVPMGGVFGCAIIMYRKYLHYTKWRPWMGAFWVLVPWSMLWMTTVWQRMILGID